MNKIGWTALGTGLLVAGGAGLVAFGSSRWAGATQAQLALLDVASVPAPAGQNKLYDDRELEGLPTPVQRYFRAVLKDGQPLIDERGSGVGKDMVMLPWDCSLSNYELRHGMLVPTRGIVASGGRPYFVGNLTSLAYGFSL